MKPARLAIAILLVVAGVTIAGFFGLLLGIADCSAACQARGERAPVYAFIGAGIGLVAMGLTLRTGTMRATGVGMLCGGLVAMNGALYVIWAEAGRGAMVWVTLVAGGGFVLVGAWLRFRRPSR